MTPAAERVEAAVRSARGRIRRARALESALKGALHGALAAGAYLVIQKFTGWPAALAAAAVVPPLALGAAAALRRLDLRQAAAALDRVLGGEERVATALEGGSGPLVPLAVEDAARALDRSDLRRVGAWRWPAEARLLVPALAFLAVLALLPGRGRSLAAEGPSVRDAVDAQARELERAADPAKVGELAARAREILRGLEGPDPVAAAVAARRLAVEIRAGLAGGMPDPDGARRELAGRLEAAGSAASRELARRGIDVPSVDPADLEARALAAKGRGGPAGASGRPESFDVAAVAGGAPVDPGVAEAARRKLADHAWDPKYDDLVRRYYSQRDR